jgi:hypothetical protein
VSPGQRLQVRVAETPADLGGLSEGSARGRGIAARHALQRGRQQQIPLLDTVQMVVVKQPPGPDEPAAAAGQLTPACYAIHRSGSTQVLASGITWMIFVIHDHAAVMFRCGRGLCEQSPRTG